MAFCERQRGVYYVLGLGKNSVLVERVQHGLFWAAVQRCLTGGPGSRQFSQFAYQPVRGSWSRPRRVVAKAEVTAEGANPRFVVTNLPRKGFGHGALDAQRTYEEIYCVRGNMENVLKQQTLDLQADRMSTHHLASNQLRLWLASFAYVLLERLRALGLQGTELGSATAGTLRVKLLKVAAVVRVSVRRVYVQFCSGFPQQTLFALCLQRLKAVAWQTG